MDLNQELYRQRIPLQRHAYTRTHAFTAAKTSLSHATISVLTLGRPWCNSFSPPASPSPHPPRRLAGPLTRRGER
eukprot:9287672-Pyramimonas_sp.AAC.1